MKTVLVTGGAGFIGSHVVDRLLSAGRRVVCLDNFDSFYDPAVKRSNLSGAARNPNFLLIEGDILDGGLLDRLFRDHPIDTVFHAAARAGVRPSIQDPAVYQRVNVEGTANLLERARAVPVRNFVLASSSSVYGASRKVPFREDDPAGEPLSPYAASKRAAELLGYTYHHLYGLPVVCLRFFTAYGPRQRPEMAIHKFTHLVDSGRPVPVYGDGTASRDYTYIDDIVEGVVSALGRPLGFEVINLGGSRATPLNELVALVEKSLGRKARLEFLPDQAGDVPATIASVEKAQRLLGYEPRTSLEEGVAKFVEWYRNGSIRDEG